MDLKPEDEIQGKHEIPDWAIHKDSFTYRIKDAENVYFFGHHRDSTNTMIGSATLILEDVAYIRVCLMPKDRVKKMLFKTDVIHWLMEMGIQTVRNMTNKDFYENELLLEYPGCRKTGRWLQFGHNPLIEAVWEVRR